MSVSSPSNTLQGTASSSFGPGTSPGPHPLSSIAEKGDGSGNEDSDEDDVDEGEGGWKTPPVRSRSAADETVIKTGYLWKKGERRKVRDLLRLVAMMILTKYISYFHRHGRNAGLFCAPHTLHITKRLQSTSCSGYLNSQMSTLVLRYR